MGHSETVVLLILVPAALCTVGYVVARMVQRPNSLAVRLGFGEHLAMLPITWSSYPWKMLTKVSGGRLDLYEGGLIMTALGPRWVFARSEIEAVVRGSSTREKLVGPIARLVTLRRGSFDFAVGEEGLARLERWHATLRETDAPR